MKKLLTLTLTLILSLGVMAMTACGGGGGSGLGDLFGKSELEKAFDAIDNCTIETVGISESHKDYMEYKFTSNKVELTTAAGTKWWDATDTSDYVLLERSYETNYILKVEHKSKTEYQTGRKDTFDLLFGYIAEHEDKLTKTEAGNYKSIDGDPITHTVAGKNVQYTDVIIYMEDGAIDYAELTIIIQGDVVELVVEVGNTIIILPEYDRN
jgi:hypothetical protein